MAFKASLALHKAPSGKLSVLSCSEDADNAVKAFEACKDPGEIQLIIRGQLQKQRKVEGELLAPKKRAYKRKAL